ncbi:glutamate-1-semialdehyde 2,1-aminomutase [Amycolatopsis bartoniae]|uniref:Glutamate-1-semialdehyde 2,1-aminomutase n=1 Tax=Amycolatopsis bartoniae TaxID=941986 RepID=A0A8H9J0E4_9PSEU|nr:aminotransferase class III-fold pyridoxal phosphate-dependent enzyme [Amycolatopsis bartoniae]MBB2933559.1 glutamate-1-semialdehyde 2,1-aminomutase [Amycolatopsis bartoniae]TVT10739.1 aminotransferase class III-fold pyridoxal phosphate-dependent enzyme [Amycolatopsis bartoniae]GHF73296.1 glutamate-1-semialdehyde 2,1-aminomutase [Amycolatopsis bartoniae]
MDNAGPQLLTQSEELRRRALVRTPGGVHSNVRLSGSQEFIKCAQGAWLYGVDGRDYVDYLLGQGPNFLGHAPKHIIDAVFEACRDGVVFGGQHELEVRASELVCQAVGWADMIRFSMTGTEAVQAALRLARAATGRTKLIRFEGHYHGWLDNVLLGQRDGQWGIASAGQLESHLADSIILPWNDLRSVEEALDRHGHEVAAVIMEPVMINAGVIEPLPGYLQGVRELATRHGAVLIFDEVIAGFRLGLDGGAGRYGVTPDLATYGKAIAGGFPVAALVGNADLMNRFGTGEVNHSGTFNSSVMATAAVTATLTSLLENPPYERIAAHGTALMAGLRDIGTERGLPLRVSGLPQAFHVSFGDAEVTDYRTLQQLDLARYESLSRVLVDNGIWVTGRGVWYVSAAHGQRELEAVLSRFDKAVSEWVAQ